MNRFCIYCGAKQYENATFCHECGRQQPLPQENAATEIEKVEQGNTVGTAPRSTDTADIEPTSERKKNRKCNASFVVRTVRNSIVLAVSIVMTLLSFAPIFKWKFSEIQNVGNVEFDVSVSALDGINFLFDVAQDYNLDQLEWTDIYERFEEQTEAILEMDEKYDDNDTYEDISRKDRRIINKYIITSYRLGLQSENAKTNFTHVTIAVFSFLYILISVAFLVFAVLNFITGFGIMEKAKNLIKHVTLSLLAAMPAVIFAVYGAFFSFLSNIPLVTGVAMGSGIIANLVISLCTVALMITAAFIWKWHKQKFNVPLRAVSATLALLVMCTCFAPIFKTSVTAVFENRNSERTVDINIYSSWYENCLLSDAEKEAMEEIKDKNLWAYFHNTFKEFSSYSKREIEKGAANSYNNACLVEFLGSTCSESALVFASTIPFIFIATIICAGLVLWQNLLCFMGEKTSKKLVFVAKILTVSFAALALAATIVILATIGMSVIQNAAKGYSVVISAGVIFMIIFAVATVSVPYLEKR